MFSLSGTTNVVLHGDEKSLWSEFFCYLLISGFYNEGEGPYTVKPINNLISNKDFYLWNNNYSGRIGSMIGKGLHDRYVALRAHPYLNDKERKVLDKLDGLFSGDKSYFDLSGKDILGIAISRQLPEDMITIAQYVSRMYGQLDFPNDTMLPKLYISIFGNIHLAKHDYANIKVSVPVVRYGQVINEACRVSALYAFLSSLIEGYAALENGAQNFLEDIGSYQLAAEPVSYGNTAIALPRVINAYNVALSTGAYDTEPFSLVSKAYHNFLYGTTTTGSIDIIRHQVFKVILDHMVKMMGEVHLSRIVPPTSIYQKILRSSVIRRCEPKRSVLLNYALEALDSDTEASGDEKDSSVSSEETPEDTSSKDKIETDPSVEDGGNDPTLPDPAVPAVRPGMAEDTIELISFNKTGEGLEEDLYRSAVVVLNDKLKNDDEITIDAEVKDALDHWVNGYLYRAAISVTKERIKRFGLQKYLKKFN